MRICISIYVKTCRYLTGHTRVNDIKQNIAKFELWFMKNHDIEVKVVENGGMGANDRGKIAYIYGHN